MIKIRGYYDFTFPQTFYRLLKELKYQSRESEINILYIFLHKSEFYLY